LPNTHTGINISGNTAGNYVFYDIGNGVIVSCMHLAANSITLRRGDKVREGQVIGIMGATGRSTGIHLHFELRRNNVPFDPLPHVESSHIGVMAMDKIAVNVNGTHDRIDGFIERDRTWVKIADLFKLHTGNEIEFNMRNGVEYVQFRGFFEALGYAVTPERNAQNEFVATAVKSNDNFKFVP